MRKVLVSAWLVIIFSGILAAFWYTDLVYRLPTPVPAGYEAPAIGSPLNIMTAATTINSRPIFLHFFNPDCPCSRFNMDHVRSLIEQYGRDTDFRIVLVTDKAYTEQQIQKRFSINIPIMADSGISAACGVYSTPQAVIINSSGTLHYRGNYNRSRYCTDKKTNYAQAALEQLIRGNYAQSPGLLATKAYGCSLPGCKKPRAN